MTEGARDILWVGGEAGQVPAALTALPDGWALRTLDPAALEAGLAAARTSRAAPICVVVGLDGLGAQVLQALKDGWPQLPRVVLTDDATPASLARLVNEWRVAGVYGTAEGAALVEGLRRLALERPCTRGEELEALVSERTLLLSRAKREWELTFDAIDAPLALIDDDGNIRRANLATARAAGLDIRQVPGRPYAAVMYGSDAAPPACPVQQVLRGLPRAEGEVPASGGRVLLVNAFRSLGEGTIVCTTHDMTTELLRQRSAMHTEKMVALGQLVGGVAHEVNNPLATILAFTSLMKGDEGRTPDDLEALDAIEGSAQRCRRIIENMLRFSRRETTVHEADLSAVVREAGALFHIQAKQLPRVIFQQALAEGLPTLKLNAAQIEQVVLNLLQNALHALPGQSGTIGVKTEATAGGLRLTVWDTGTGIAPEHLGRIFEPGFTTKGEGMGTGLGLPIVRSIVAEHGGSITVESTVSAGTRFLIEFPL